MESAIWGFIGTLAGTIVGASASIATTFITARNSRKLQQDAASFERGERARGFQRDNLIELQEALSSSMRLVSRTHIENINLFRNKKNEGRNSLYSQELDQDLMVSNRKLAILTERVADQSLRDSINALRTDMANVSMARSESESYTEFKNALSTFKKTMEKVGVVLRENY